MKNNIWIWVHYRDGGIDDVTFGLIQEAKNLAVCMKAPSSIVAIAMGNDPEHPIDEHPIDGHPTNEDQTTCDPADDHHSDVNPLDRLGDCGVDRIIRFKGSFSSRYHGEAYANILSKVMEKEVPLFFLMAHGADTADLAPRLAAMTQIPILTRAVDLRVDDQGIPTAVRPIANGHLFETLAYNCKTPLIATLLPHVLVSSDPESDAKPDSDKKETIRIDPINLDDQNLYIEKKNLKTRITNVIEAAPENLDITQADIILAAGRGVGKKDGNENGMDLIYKLAGLLGASVAGTRPVIDSDDLPFERQIGQTGKTVTPRLIINCGISGANEYTAGIEKAKQIIAINTDASARIFRFADLGIVGDLHLILPLLIERIIKLKNIEID